jgi:UDP-2,3-diacylglucosamine hydrolase
MRLLVVSDLHIWGPEDPLYHSLLGLVREQAKPGDTLVLAGDVFDLFVGDKKVFLERYSGFFEALTQATAQGVKIHYIEGNHDFLMKRTLARAGVQVYPHDVSIELGGKRFFVGHGDLVDKSDYGYRALRMFFRSPLIRVFVKVAPGEWIDRIGQSSSQRSRAAKPRLPSELPLERIELVRKAFRNYACERMVEGYDYVVLGHCHDLDQMRFSVDGRPGQYVNVGYPRVHGSFLSWSEGDAEIQREPLPGQKS